MGIIPTQSCGCSVFCRDISRHVATFLVDDVLDVVVVAVERAGVVGHDAAAQHPLGLGHGVAWTQEPGSALHQHFLSLSFSIIFLF